jgi:hypothetical protein
MNTTLISSEGKSPTVVMPRHGGGVVIRQNRQQVILDDDELGRLLDALEDDAPVPTSATPSDARWGTVRDQARRNLTATA